MPVDVTRGDEPAVEPGVPAVHGPVAPLEVQVFHAIDTAPARRPGWRFSDVAVSRLAVSRGRQSTGAVVFAGDGRQDPAQQQVRLAAQAQPERRVEERRREGDTPWPPPRAPGGPPR